MKWFIYNLWLYFFPPKTNPENLALENDLELKIDETPKKIRPIVYFNAGGFGGVCSVLVGQPMDTIKTRLQTMPTEGPPKYKGTFDCFVKILRTQGIRGLYDGLGIQITSVAPAYAISFFGYGLGKSLQEGILGANNNEFNALNYFIAGTFSGLFTAVVMAPAERVKVILQVQSAKSTEPQVVYEDRCGPKYTGSIDVVIKLYKEGGVRSVYKGALLTFMRDIPGYGTFFMTYEILKTAMMTNTVDLPLPPYKTILAGGLAGIANWIVALPCDNMKSILQSAPEYKYRNGLKEILTEMFCKRGGVLSLYTGLMPVLLRAFPANAACFLGFEYCKNSFNFFVK